MENTNADSVSQLPPRRVHLLAAAAFFAAIAVYGSLVPFEYQSLAWGDAVRRFGSIRYLQLGVGSRADWVANILLFIPLGFFSVAAIAADRKPIVAVAAALPLVLALGAISVAIEFTQLWFPNRTVSQNDIIAEMMGGAIGVGLWIIVGQAILDWVRSFFAAHGSQNRSHQLLQLYTFGLLVYSVLPLDLTIRLGELYEKYKSGKMILVPLSYGYDSLADVIYNVVVDTLVFIPVGMLAARGWFQELPNLRPVPRAIGIGALLVAGIELAQLFVYSRVSDVTDLLTCTMGVACGVWWAHYWQPSGRRAAETASRSLLGGRWVLWATVVVVYTLVLIGVFWFPFDFRVESDFAKPRLARFFEVPFKWMYRGSEFKAIREFLRKTLLFGGLGALFVQCIAQLNLPTAIRRLFLAGAILYCMLLATGIELGQVILPSHTPDFTDVLLCSIGAAAGIVVASFVRRRRGAGDS